MKSFEQIHYMVTLINVLIKVKPEDFLILTEQIILEASALQIRWKSKRPELHDGSGDALNAAIKSELFAGLQYSRRSEIGNIRLGRQIGLVDSETNALLMGYSANRIYGKSDIHVTAQDVAYALILNLYDSNGFESCNVEIDGTILNIPIAEDVISDSDKQFIRQCIDFGYRFEFLFGFKGAYNGK